MNRREQLISKTLSPSMDEKEAKMLDTTMRLILGDMGEMFIKFWETEGPGVMCFQPDSDRTMFFLTLEELHKKRKNVTTTAILLRAFVESWKQHRRLIRRKKQVT